MSPATPTTPSQLRPAAHDPLALVGKAVGAKGGLAVGQTRGCLDTCCVQRAASSVWTVE